MDMTRQGQMVDDGVEEEEGGGEREREIMI